MSEGFVAQDCGIERVRVLVQEVIVDLEIIVLWTWLGEERHLSKEH